MDIRNSVAVGSLELVSSGRDLNLPEQLPLQATFCLFDGFLNYLSIIFWFCVCAYEKDTKEKNASNLFPTLEVRQTTVSQYAAYFQSVLSRLVRSGIHSLLGC